MTCLLLQHSWNPLPRRAHSQANRLLYPVVCVTSTHPAMPLYGSSKYWEAHYQDDDDETYDWLLPFSALRSVLVEYGGCQSLGLRSRLATLIVGCGKSELCEQMYDAGWKTMTAVDISGTVIRHMEQRKYDRRGKPIRRGLTFEVRDACNLPSPQYDEQFDLVIDKSTLDAMLCSRGESILIVDKYLRSIYRTLKFGGTYIAVSLGPPKRRLSKLKREGLKWHIQVIEIPKPGKCPNSYPPLLCSASWANTNFALICRHGRI